MTLHLRSLFVVLALTVSVGTVACGTGSTTPPTADFPLEAGDAGHRGLKDAADGEVCQASPPPNALCYCPYGYKGGSGTFTCECCSGIGADAAVDAGSSPATCCDPATKPPPGIEGVWCCGNGSWIHDIGSGDQEASCRASGGVGEICTSETCGGPPPAALCKQCPNGINGYKQIDGQPTCECCGT